MIALALQATAGATDLPELPDDLPDDIGLPERTSGPADVPYPLSGLRVTGGATSAQTPLSAASAVTFELRPAAGLRVDLTAAAWVGPAREPREDATVTVLLPAFGAGVAYEAPTTTAVRPWVGADVRGVLVVADPVLVGPAVTARAGADVGRGWFAWTFDAAVGALVTPPLRALSAERYRAVAPVLSVHTGPSVRFGERSS